MRSKAVLREHIEDVAWISWIHLAPSYQCDLQGGFETLRQSHFSKFTGARRHCGGLLWPSPARSSTKLLKSVLWRRYGDTGHLEAPWPWLWAVESRREQIPSVKLYGVYGKRRGRAAQGSQRANEDIIASCPALSLGIAALLLKSQHKQKLHAAEIIVQP
jgi:hypothetical protein